MWEDEATEAQSTDAGRGAVYRRTRAVPGEHVHSECKPRGAVVSRLLLLEPLGRIHPPLCFGPVLRGIGCEGTGDETKGMFVVIEAATIGAVGDRGAVSFEGL